jgi:hypothetical protein
MIDIEEPQMIPGFYLISYLISRNAAFPFAVSRWHACIPIQCHISDFSATYLNADISMFLGLFLFVFLSACDCDKQHLFLISAFVVVQEWTRSGIGEYTSGVYGMGEQGHHHGRGAVP